MAKTSTSRVLRDRAVARQQSLRESIDDHEPDTSLLSRPTAIIAGLLALVAIGLAVFGVAMYLRDQPPGDTSADAGFSRDMAAHHAQAVDMALIVRDRTDDDLIKLIATDIMLTQQSQIGVMNGMLTAWELSSSGTEPPLAWMGDDVNQPMPGTKEGDSSSHMMDGMMPGMATDEEIEALKTLPVDQMNIQFLTLMIRHHQGGVWMAESAMKRAETDQVVDFAKAIVASQNAEISQMQQMLAERQSSQ